MAFDPDAHLTLELRDGTPVLIRPFTLDDRDRLAEAFRLLSPESSYFRFWTRFRELNPKFIDDLCSTDQVDHIGWVMIHRQRDDIPGLGGASLWRMATDSQAAEVSFTVADEFQGRGVGTMLLAVLWLHARLLGIERLVGLVLDSNIAMRSWWESLGATSIQISRGWEMTLLLDESLLPDNAISTRFRHWLKMAQNEPQS